MTHNQKDTMNPLRKFAEVIVAASQKPQDVPTDCKMRLEETYILFAEKHGLTQKCKFLIIHEGFMGSGDPSGFRIRALVTSSDPHFDIISVDGTETSIEVPEGRFKLGIKLKRMLERLNTKKRKVTVSVVRRQRKTKKEADYGSQSHETGGTSGGGRFY